jgi:hypothetical protein
MADYIPSPDEKFDTWLAGFVKFVTANAATTGIPPNLAASLSTALAGWSPAWQAWQSVQTQAAALLQSKNSSRATAETLARQIAQMLQKNPTVTDAQKAAAGITVPKTTHTPVAPLSTHPVLYKVENEHLLQRLWFSDEATPGSKARPKGAAMCEIREQIVPPGGAAPTDPDTLPFLANETKTPHRNDLAAADVGKTVYYAQRWINTVGAPGPWSPITSYLIT